MRLRLACTGLLTAALICLGLDLGLGQERQSAHADSGMVEVDMQLILAVDISYSISLDEQDIQRRGYAAAFRDDEIIRAITNGYRGRIAVTYLEWAGQDTQIQLVPWTLISDRASARAFADRLEIAPVNRKGRTSLSQALSVAIDLFAQSPFVANRNVVDISSDGFNNNGPRIDRVRDRLVYNGVTINGLPLMAGADSGPLSLLDRYFQDCVTGGLGSFTEPVVNWREFGPTLKKKLIAEIAENSNPWQVAPLARIYLAGGDDDTVPEMDCLFGEKEDLREYIKQLEKAVGKNRAPRWMPREQDWPMPD